jgi:hypothetical protein
MLIGARWKGFLEAAVVLLEKVGKIDTGVIGEGAISHLRRILYVERDGIE